MTRRRWIIAAIVFAGLCFVPCAAQAQVKPFSVVGAGRVSHLPFPGDAAEHWSVGVATHVGTYTQEGAFVEALSLIQLPPELFYQHKYGTVVAYGEFQSAAPVEFRALASGGALTFDYGHKTPGIVELILVGGSEDNPIFVTEWDAIFTLVKGTGRLRKAIGGEFRMIAVSEQFGNEAFIPNYGWDTPGVIYHWHSLPGGWVKFKK